MGKVGSKTWPFLELVAKTLSFSIFHVSIFFSDIDECTSNTHTCDKNAVCTNNLGGYKCRCKQGFEHFKEGRFCVREGAFISRLIFSINLQVFIFFGVLPFPDLTNGCI